jgi:hypothetical protein
MKNGFHLIVKLMELMFMVSAGGENKCQEERELREHESGMRTGRDGHHRIHEG